MKKSLRSLPSACKQALADDALGCVAGGGDGTLPLFTEPSPTFPPFDDDSFPYGIPGFPYGIPAY